MFEEIQYRVHHGDLEVYRRVVDINGEAPFDSRWTRSDIGPREKFVAPPKGAHRFNVFLRLWSGEIAFVT